MKLSEMRELTIDEMQDEIVALRKKLLELRIIKSQHKLDNTSQIGSTKNQIAQLKSLIRDKQLAK